jgi:hypothetical protein
VLRDKMLMNRESLTVRALNLAGHLFVPCWGFSYSTASP